LATLWTARSIAARKEPSMKSQEPNSHGDRLLLL
jgi:hypothetical protein